MKPSSWLVGAGLLGCMVLGTLAACGDSGGSKGPTSYVGEETSALIKADTGGDLAVGAVKIKVPAEALSKDTTLTVKVADKDEFPDKSKLALDVYEFGPKGTMFEKEVELEFDLQGIELDQKRPDVAVLDEEANTWKILASSKVQGGKIHAKTTHFSFYTVLLSEASNSGGDAPRCDADFTPCGGDLEGTWEFTSGCVAGFVSGVAAPPPITDGSDTCGDTVSTVSLSASGTASFGVEGSYSIDQTLVVDSYYRISLACLAEISRLGGTPLTCDDLEGVVSGDVCEQSTSSGDVPSLSSGSYSSEGGILTLESPDGYVVIGLSSVDPVVDYCVEGDTLTLRLQDPTSESNTQVYVATRTAAP